MKVPPSAFSLLTMAMFGLSGARSYATVYFDDTFAGNTGNSVSTSSSGFSSLYLPTGYSAYVMYTDHSANSVYSLTDSATAGINGGSGLVLSRSGAGDLNYGGVNGGAAVNITEFTPGQVTAAQVGHLMLSFDLGTQNFTGSNELFLNPCDANETKLGADTMLLIQVPGSSNAGFQRYTLDASTLPQSTLQAFANDLNGGNSTYVSFQWYNPFTDNSANPSVTLSNLEISTAVPEPTALSALGLGVLVIGSSRMARRRLA